MRDVEIQNLSLEATAAESLLQIIDRHRFYVHSCVLLSDVGVCPAMKKKKGSPRVQEKTTNGRWQLTKDVRQNQLKVELKISHLEKGTTQTMLSCFLDQERKTFQICLKNPEMHAVILFETSNALVVLH